MKNDYIFLAIFCLLLSFPVTKGAFAQGMIVNEFSNGDGGTREYMEFVVVGPDANPNCGPVDLRGWIVDDNNGDFSCGPCSGSGIAQGHIRLSFASTWEAVAPGTIIVVYNDAPGETNVNMPPADPMDTIVADGVHIVPSSSPLVEVSTLTGCTDNIPVGVTACPGPCTGISTYAGACYTSGGTWNNAGMRNSGDVAQVRTPSGAYFHGVGYGTASSGINGGPDNLFFSGAGDGDFYFFDNSTSDDYRNIANWSTASVSTNGETPGAANNLANALWIASLSNPCPLPVVYAQQLEGQASSEGNTLTWTTASEVNSDKFILEKSLNANGEFTFLGEVEAAGNSSERLAYQFTDPQPSQVTWYRLRQMDLDGQENISHVAMVVNDLVHGTAFEAWPNPADQHLQFKVEGGQAQSVELVDITGRVISTVQPTDQNEVMEGVFDTSSLEPGLYLLRARTTNSLTTKRVVLSH